MGGEKIKIGFGRSLTSAEGDITLLRKFNYLQSKGVLDCIEGTSSSRLRLRVWGRM